MKIASTMQLVHTQVSEIERGEQCSEEICALRGKSGVGKQCYGCGGYGHAIHDPDCPAHGKVCFKCKGEGHFQEHCIKSTSKEYGEKSYYLGIEDSDEDYIF